MPFPFPLPSYQFWGQNITSSLPKQVGRIILSAMLAKFLRSEIVKIAHYWWVIKRKHRLFGGKFRNAYGIYLNVRPKSTKISKLRFDNRFLHLKFAFFLIHPVFRVIFLIWQNYSSSKFVNRNEQYLERIRTFLKVSLCSFGSTSYAMIGSFHIL